MINNKSKLFTVSLSEAEAKALVRVLSMNNEKYFEDSLNYLKDLLRSWPDDHVLMTDFRLFPAQLRHLDISQIDDTKCMPESLIVKALLAKWDNLDLNFYLVSLSLSQNDRDLCRILADFFVEEVSNFIVENDCWYYFPTVYECAKLIRRISKQMYHEKGEKLEMCRVVINELARIQQELLEIM